MSDYDDDFDDFVEFKDSKLPGQNTKNILGKQGGDGVKAKGLSRVSQGSIQKSDSDASLPEAKGLSKNIDKASFGVNNLAAKASDSSASSKTNNFGKLSNKSNLKSSVINKFNVASKKLADKSDDDEYGDNDDFHEESDNQDSQKKFVSSKPKKSVKFPHTKTTPRNKFKAGSRGTSPRLKPELSLGKYQTNSDTLRGARSKRAYGSLKKSLNNTLYSKHPNISSLRTIEKPRIKLNPMVEVQNDIYNFHNLREMSSAQENEHAQLLYLAKENKVLQQEFKDLNLSLNKFIEMMKDFKYS